MAAPTLTLIKNSGRGYSRHGRNQLQVFAVSAGTDNFADAAIIDLSAEFTDVPPYPLGVKIYSINGKVDGTCTNLKLEYNFLSDIEICDFIAPNVQNEFNWENGVKSPTSALLDACGTAWTGATNVTQADETTVVIDSGTSQSLTIAAAFSTGIIGYLSGYSAVDAQDWEGVSFYIRSSIALQPDDLQFCIDETAAIASPDETLSIPIALAANTWYFVKLYFTGGITTRNAIISHGLKATRDFGAGVIYIDNVRYIKKSSKYGNGLSGSVNVNTNGYGDVVMTSIGVANLDTFYLDLSFEFIFKEDNIR